MLHSHWLPKSRIVCFLPLFSKDWQFGGEAHPPFLAANLLGNKLPFIFPKSKTMVATTKIVNSWPMWPPLHMLANSLNKVVHVKYD